MTFSMPRVVCSRPSWVSMKHAITQYPGFWATTDSNDWPCESAPTQPYSPMARAPAALSLPAFALSAPAAPQGRPLVRVPRVRAPYRGGGSRQTLGGVPAVGACGGV